MTMSRAPTSISPLSFCPVVRSNGAPCPVVWFDGASHFDHEANLPVTEGFGFGGLFGSGDISGFGILYQEEVAEHPALSARLNTASLRRPTSPLRGLDGQRLARGICSPHSILLAPMASDAAIACLPACHWPSLRLTAAPFGRISSGRS